MARVVLIGPSDSLTALLAERLEPGGSCRVITAPAAYDDLAAEGAAAVVYRPPLAGRRDARPDLADADRFAEVCVRGGVRRIVLLSSAAAHPPSHHNTGYLGEDEKLPTDHPVASAWRELERRVTGRLTEAGAEVVVL